MSDKTDKVEAYQKGGALAAMINKDGKVTRKHHVVMLSFLIESVLSRADLFFESAFLDGISEQIVVEAERTDQYPFINDALGKRRSARDIEESGMYR